MMPIKLTPEIITAAIEGFESQKRRIDAQIAELRTMLSGGSTETVAPPEVPGRKRPKMSASGREAIAEAQRKRWAAIKGQSEAHTVEPSKPKRKLSAAGRAAIVAAMKKRWALKRAEAANAKSPTAKKSAPARKKATAKKAAVRRPMPKAAKTVPVKKATAKKKAVPVAAPTVTEAAAQ